MERAPQGQVPEQAVDWVEEEAKVWDEAVETVPVQVPEGVVCVHPVARKSPIRWVLHATMYPVRNVVLRW
jgi:hypothetical protein